MHPRSHQILIHLALLLLAALVYVPFAFVVNNSLRSNDEITKAFFGIPEALKAIVKGEQEAFEAQYDEAPTDTLTKGYTLSWATLRRYMFNALLVSGISALMVVTIGSLTAYVLSRYRFFGSRAAFAVILSTMMIPAVLTLVPTYLIVKDLGLLNTRWGLILPYVAGGQVFGIFVCRSFFASLPEDLFESARIDGAGHMSIYLKIVLPLTLPALSVVAVMNILATWNNFLWPLVVISKDEYQVVASGLYVMASSQVAHNQSTMYASYVLVSVPLLVLFVYATRPFVRGVTSGAIKA